MQRIAPFDDESLRSAFTVEAGPVADVSVQRWRVVWSEADPVRLAIALNRPQIDLSLLESDDVDKQSPSKKKRKRKHQRDGTNEKPDEAAAAKRAKLSAVARR